MHLSDKFKHKCEICLLPEACELVKRHMSPVLVFFVPPDKHGEGLRRPRYAQRFYCSTCRWWVSCRKSIYPSIPRTCVPLLRHCFHRACPISPPWSSVLVLDRTRTVILWWHIITITFTVRCNITEHTQGNSTESDGTAFEEKLSTRLWWQRT